MVIAENIANLPGDDFISQPELLSGRCLERGRAALIPDLVISFGGQVVSKQLKIFLQKLPDLRHVEIGGNVAASLATLEKPGSEHEKSGSEHEKTAFRNQFMEHWKQEQERARLRIRDKIQSLEYGNLWVVNAVHSAAPSGSVVHLGNSTTIRYSQLLPLRADLTYYSNRGTSGIDGCVSSAVGAAMVSDQLHILLVGDLSFVYDSNALWNKDFPAT